MKKPQKSDDAWIKFIPCGCGFSGSTKNRDFLLVSWCPLHAAADAMLDVLLGFEVYTFSGGLKISR